jgi:hypothetical protein
MHINIDAPPLVLHSWWSLILGSVLVILEEQRQTALRGITKYNVKYVVRPPLRITQARVLQRLRDRTVEENFRRESDQDLSQGILMGEVLDVIQDQEVILSPLLGGGRISRQGSSMNANPGFRKNNAPQGQPAEGHWRRSTPPIQGAKHGYVFFDGACSGNTTLALDCEYVVQTTNNDAEYCGYTEHEPW